MVKTTGASTPPSGARASQATIKNELFTIGYQEKSALEFVRLLRSRNINVLVDIRATPMSRRAEFRQKALAVLLEDAGIRYHGMRSLGTPNALRDALKESGDYKLFFSEFNAFLQKQTAALRELMDLVSRERCALMCFEREARHCHRSAVAAYVSSKLSCNAVDL